MQTNDLRRIMPPPAAPFQNTGDWRPTEDSLYTSLPSDYKRFIAEYGCGRIGDFLFLLNPNCRNPHVNLLSGGEERLEALRVLRQGGEKQPYPLNPEENGVLPVGGTDNGDTLYWITSGAPDQWEVVVSEARGPMWERFPMGVTDFVAGILAGTIRCSIFPDSFPGGDTQFRPFDGNVVPE